MSTQDGTLGTGTGTGVQHGAGARRAWGRKPKDLLARAGMSGVSVFDERAMEALEQRQLLFAVAPDIFSAAARGATANTAVPFGYVMPFLLRTDVPAVPQGGTPTPSRFGTWWNNLIRGAVAGLSGPTNRSIIVPNLTAAAGPPNPRTAVFSTRTQFANVNAGTQLTSTIANPGVLQALTPEGDQLTVTARGGAAGTVVDGPGAERSLNVATLGANQSVTFSFRGAAGTLRPMQAFSFSLPNAGAGGFGGATIDLLRNGVVVRAIAANELTAAAGEFRFTDPANPGQLLFIFKSTSTGPGPAFDEVRINGNDAGGLQISRVAAFAPVMAEVFDLYGRPMRARTDLGQQPGPDGQIPPETPANVDVNDNGVPDFNDGIGQVRISNNDRTSTASFGMAGGTVTLGTDPQPFRVLLSETLTTSYTTLFQAGGFGYGFVPGGNGQLAPIAPGGGSVIFGSPWIRDNTSTATYLGPAAAANPPAPVASSIPAPATWDFQSALPAANANDTGRVFGGSPQGVYTPRDAITGRGESVGAVSIDGVVHGTSQIGGAISRFNADLMLGSLRVFGDAGLIAVNADAGFVYVRPQPDPSPPPTGDTGQGRSAALAGVTGSQITVERTLGQLLIGGRNYAQISVRGDVNNPLLGRIDRRNYTELERPLNAFAASFQAPATAERAARSAATGIVPFGAGFIMSGSLLAAPALINGNLSRNGTNAGAEYVGSSVDSVVINGNLNLFTPFGDVDDAADRYAFSASPDRAVQLRASWNGPGANTFRMTVLDDQGNILAKNSFPFLSQNRTAEGDFSTTISFRPTYAGQFYLLVEATPDNQPSQIPLGYSVTMDGILPTVAGSIKIGAASDAPVYSVNGTLGQFSIGETWTTEVDAGDQNGLGRVFDSAENIGATNASAFNTMRNVNLTVNGSLYAVRAGGDLSGSVFNVRGDIGTVTTGVAITAFTQLQGDLTGVTINADGRIGIIRTLGSVGYVSDGDFGASQPGVGGSVVINSGLNPLLRGDIGALLFAGAMVGTRFTLNLPAGATLDRFQVGDLGGFDPAGAADAGVVYLGVPRLNLGQGANIRFARVTAVTSNFILSDPIPGTLTTFTTTTPARLTDDSGAEYTLSLSGGRSAAGNLAADSVGTVLTLPVNGSTGVVVAGVRIVMSGVQAPAFTVTATTRGQLDLGLIAIAGAGQQAPLPNSVTITGVVPVNVLELDSFIGITTLTNSTRNGSMVAIDTLNLTSATIAGDLGSTTTVPGGPTNLAPFRGYGAGGVGLGFLVNPDAEAGDGIADGAPLDTFLNGLRVSSGDVNLVSVGGQVGDVILQGLGGFGILRSLIANSDNLTAPGRFDGIVGNIFAPFIQSVDIGDGLVSPGDTPQPRASIAASGRIGTITGGARVRNPIFNGLVIASNVGTAPGFTAGTIGTINLTGANVSEAVIQAATLSSWWRSPETAALTGITGGDPETPEGSINAINITNSRFFSNRLFAGVINNVTLTGTDWDASIAESRGTIASIRARSFLNSTRDGEEREYRLSQIIATGEITTIAAVGPNGDVSDTRIESNTRIRSAITGRNFTRVIINANTDTAGVNATGDIIGSEIATGRLTAVNAARIVNTTIRAVGEIGTINARSILGANISSTGPDGRIGTVNSTGALTGSIVSDGPITTLGSTGLFGASVRITGLGRGGLANANLGTLRSGGDLQAVVDVPGNVTSITATGSIGRNPALVAGQRDRVLIGGNLGSLTTSGGTIYADIRVSGAVTGSIAANGRVNNRPGTDLAGNPQIEIGGRLPSLIWAGDFNGTLISNSGGIGTVSITNGSFRRGAGASPNRIEARDGDITSISITNGSLFGDVIARDGSINSIVVAGANFGDLGVNPNRSSGTVVTGETLRNQLPPDATNTANRDGPSIRAGRDILTITVAGSVFESGIYAGRRLGTVNVTGGFNADSQTTLANSSFLAAGAEITSINVGNGLRGVTVVAGVSSLGADNRPGGTGASADTVGAGSIGAVTVRAGGSDSSTFSAGIVPDNTGAYNTASSRVAPGLSTIGNIAVTGAVVNTSAFADTSIGTTSAGITRGAVAGSATQLTQADNRVYTGPTTGANITAVPVTGAATTIAVGAQNAVVRISAPAGVQAAYDQANRVLILFTTTINAAGAVASLTIEGATGVTSLSNLRVVTTSNVSVTSLNVRVPLTGNSSVYVDGNIGSATLVGGFNTTGAVSAGGNITSLTVGTAGVNPPANVLNVSARTITTLTFNGDFGTSTNSRIDAEAIGSAVFNAGMFGVLTSQFDVTSFRVTGSMAGRVRAGGDIGTVSAGDLTSARISARGNIGPVSVTRDVFNAVVYAGTDLGSNVDFTSPLVTSGNIGAVTVGGNFLQSDLAAGVSRGASGFIGNNDRLVSDGRSTVGAVTIRGSQVGGPFGNQSFGVVSNGAVGRVTVANQQVIGSLGNFTVTPATNSAAPLQVINLVVSQTTPDVYVARVSFNQAVNPSSLASSFAISEVRASGTPQETTVNLIAGTDFTVAYDANTQSALISFTTALARRSLTVTNPGPNQVVTLPNQAAPGLYRFTVLATNLRSTTTSRLDGNGDGVISGDTDNFVGYAVVGDTGDRVAPGVVDLSSPTGATVVNLYPAADLNALMTRGGRALNGRPDLNSTFVVNGELGNHPNRDVVNFDAGGDVDVFRVFLRAGQVLRLSNITGGANLASRIIFDSTFAPVAGSGLLQGARAFDGAIGAGPSPAMTRLNSTQTVRLDLVTSSTNLIDENFLVNATGTYFIAMARLPDDVLNPLANPINDPTIATSGAPVADATGTYSFQIGVFDDGDTGFFAAASQTGSRPVSVPTPADFANAGVTVNRNNAVAGLPAFTFRLLPGANGSTTSRDAVIRGSDGAGVLSTRTAGPDGILGNGDDVIRLTDEPGTAAVIQNVPLVPTDFAGTDGILGNADDLSQIVRGDFTYRLVGGGTAGRPDGNGLANRASRDQVVGTRNVTGDQRARMTVVRTAGPDGIFNTADDRVTSTVDSSLDDRDSTGLQGGGIPDIDVFQLNNGGQIAAGTRLRITLKVNQVGGNLGLLQPERDSQDNNVAFRNFDTRGLIQFALFDTSAATNISDANLVASPGNALAFAGARGQQVTSSLTSYGYDANGDVFMDVVVPPRQDNAAQSGTFAVYVQGILRSNYQVSVEQLGTVTLPTTPRVQNILINFGSGQVNWLESGGRITQLNEFSASALGFTGSIRTQTGDVDVRSYIQQNLVLQLRALFTAAGLGNNVNISSSPLDFAGQQFSTVFVTGSLEPAGFFNNGTFGASQRIDLFNANPTDEAVVFTPSIAAVKPAGIAPERIVDSFVGALTAASGRRIGELLGLRIAGGALAEVMSDRSPAASLAGTTLGSFATFTIPNTPSPLSRQASVNLSTRFVLGNINARNLLNRIFFNP